MSDAYLNYLAERAFSQSLTGILLRLAQQKMDLMRQDLTDAFGKEIASIGMYAEHKPHVYAIARSVAMDLESTALIQKIKRIALQKKAKFFNKSFSSINTSLSVEEDLKARLGLIVMSATKDALPELKKLSTASEVWADLEAIKKKLRGEK